jgi:hypothetical protein
MGGQQAIPLNLRASTCHSPDIRSRVFPYIFVMPRCRRLKQQEGPFPLNLRNDQRGTP